MGKNFKKILCVILSMVLILGSLPLSSLAADSKDGASKLIAADDVVIKASTDKSKYQTDEEITIKLTVTNKSSKKYDNIGINMAFNGFKFDSEKGSDIIIGELNPGETKTAEFNVNYVKLSLTQRFIFRIVMGFTWMLRNIWGFSSETVRKYVKVGEVKYLFVFCAYEAEGEEEEEPKPEAEEYTVSFDLNYEGAPTAESQKVKKGEYAKLPEMPEREGYAFVGWFTTDNSKELFNFYSTKIESDLTLMAKWVDVSDTTDTDNDGIPDVIEELYGTDTEKDDTDGDGLSDYIEIVNLGLNPLKVDSDANDINDGDEDNDSDGLTNIEEIKIGTDPTLEDTDGDMVFDKNEIELGTDPLKKDTDGDGVSDGKEIELGTDPLVAQDSFDIVMSSEENGDSVKPTVEITLNGSQVETLSIEEFNNDTFFPETMPGYIGKAYNFSVDGNFDKATISFEFDTASLAEDSEPTIYYYNETEQELEALDTAIQGNVASAEVKHFSKYILVDRTIYEKSFSWIDVWDSDKNYTGVEIVLVIDDSGSMDWNDSSAKRLSVAKDLINKLPQNSKVGIVKFESNTSILTSSLTSDKNTANSYLTTSYFRSNGGTRMYDAINSSFSLFDTTDESIMKVMVVLSDGDTEDTGRHSSTINTANSKNVKIYTVGLGDSTSYFNNYLKPLAVNTTGAFYLASNADQLSDIYNNISQKIDIETDSDNDGVPDYYEDNMIIFSGVKLALDKNNPDTDGDGIKDGEEVVLKYEYNNDRTKVKVTGRIISNPDKKHTFKTVAYDIQKNDVSNNINMNIKEFHPFLGLTSTMMELSTDASNMLQNVPVALDAFSFACSWLENSVSITQLNVTTSKDNTMSIKYGSSIELDLSGKKTSLSTLLVNRYYNYSPTIVFTANKKADECIRNWFGLSGSGTYSMELDFGRVYVGAYGYYLIYENGEFYQVPIIHEDTTMYVYYKEGKKVTKLFDAASILRGIRIKLSEDEKAKVLNQLKKNGFTPA